MGRKGTRDSEKHKERTSSGVRIFEKKEGSVTLVSHQKRERCVTNALYSKQSPQSSPISLILSAPVKQTQEGERVSEIKGRKEEKNTEVNYRGRC